jgi:arabinan endo-1,5-alpha-L-arabinosidase
MKKFLTVFFVCTAISGSSLKLESLTVASTHVPLADPFILTYDNKYYAYGTSDPNGIVVYTSDDLKYWTKEPDLALHKDGSYADRRFWAPEVYRVNGRFYMYYSADEHICVATSDSPSGPFRQDVHEPMMNEKAIDNSLFIDDDGKAYLFFVRFTDGNAIWVAELNDDLKTLKMETLHPCIHVSQDWENVMARVNEGPFVVKHKGIYYMTYSANHYQSHDYGIGVATADNIMGKWEKYASNPLLRKPEGLFGAGHHCLFTDKNGQLRVAFHAHKSDTAIHPREMYITAAQFVPDTATGRDLLSISPDFRTTYVKKASGTYKNPVVDVNLPDPTVLKAEDGYFYLYATGKYTPVFRSWNLVDWEKAGHCFTDETRPSWEPQAGIWAPDINFIDGKYVLYYSHSVWGGEWTCGVGVAVSDKPEGPFTDRGAMFRSNTIGVKNSIDPFYIEDDGKKYLIWGSFRGIYCIELADDGLAIKAGAEKIPVAGTATEGSYVHKRGKYYYYFGSAGTCCEGAGSTYTVVTARSESLFGPYLTKDGKSLADNYYETILQGNSVFAGPGHNAEIVTDDEGNDWLLYHAYMKSNPENGRVLLMDRIVWEEGWPAISNLVPSSESEAPVFYGK